MGGQGWKTRRGKRLGDADRNQMNELDGLARSIKPVTAHAAARNRRQRIQERETSTRGLPRVGQEARLEIFILCESNRANMLIETSELVERAVLLKAGPVHDVYPMRSDASDSR